jgi:aspartyl-tRNA(Asn)/glutamyl-tRNA(Gln) amidotransferase subunit C
VSSGGTPLRDDEGPAIPLARPLDAFAPAVRDGFFLVPRLASHASVGAPGAAGADDPDADDSDAGDEA